MRTRLTFIREFKPEAASLILDQGFNVRDLCDQLDLQKGAPRRWVIPPFVADAKSKNLKPPVPISGLA